MSKVVINQELTEKVAIPEAQATKPKVLWVVVGFMTIIHAGAIASLWHFSWAALGVCIVLHWMTGGLGITLAYHRMLTHRSFTVPKPVEYFFTLLALLACQGGPISWVTAHRVHHAYSDKEEDPHSPRKGFFWSHMGWCLIDNPRISTEESFAKIAPDLAKDPIHRMFEKTHILWTFALAGFLYAWGGLPFVLWGICMRLVLVYHCTWFVNSASHIWGYKTYASKDDSTNLWWVALITYGEGWHNNHHAFQFSAKHGLRWWELDSTYVFIRTLQLLGLATAVKLPSAHLMNTKARA